MKTARKTAIIFASAALLAVSLSACGAGPSAPSRFYVLSTTAELENQKGLFKPKRQRTIGVGPISLPAYLDKTQIVTKETRYRLGLAELDQWAEPLRDNASRVLVDNIAILLASDRVHAFPSDTATRDDYQVSVNIIDFDCRLTAGCKLVARWSVFNLRKNRLVSATRSAYPAAQGQAGYEGLAQAMSEALAELSREIARAVGTL